MALGANFPPAFRRAQLRKQLKPGVVIKMQCVMDDGKVHEKRFVVIHADAKTVACVVNSAVSEFIQHRPELLKCQVLIASADHAFMNHDSHIDCSKTWKFSTEQVLDELMERTEWVLGPVGSEVRAQMVSAIKHAPTLSASEAEELCASLEAAE